MPPPVGLPPIDLSPGGLPPIDLEAALEGDRIVPAYQPIVLLRDRSTVGFEILSRWPDPPHGPIGPDVFIPWIEAAGLLDRMTVRQMRQAFTAARSWPGDFFLAFNLSPGQVRTAHLPEMIGEVARDCGFPCSRIHLEITETAIFHDVVQAEAWLGRLRAMGCHIAIDDFGTGFSNLGWLQALPFTKIKIDRSYVASMLTQRASRKIVASVIGLGESLGLSVVGEGVETEEQAELLRGLGCDLAQGYLFGRAVPAAEAPALLNAPSGSPHAPRRSRLSLEKRAGQIRALYDDPFLAMAFLDTRRRILDASASFARRLNRQPEALIGRPVTAFLPVGPLLEKAEHEATEGGPEPLEIDMPDGSVSMLTLHAVRDEGGETLGHSLAAIDVTGRHRAENALREAESLVHPLALQHQRSWMADPSGRVLSLSPRSPLLTQMRIEDFGTTGWLSLVHPEDRERARRCWEDSVATGQPLDHDLRFRTEAGDYHWFRVYALAHRDAAGRVLGWHGQSQDIEPRIRALAPPACPDLGRRLDGADGPDGGDQPPSARKRNGTPEA